LHSPPSYDLLNPTDGKHTTMKLATRPLNWN